MAGWGHCRRCQRRIWWGESRIDPDRVWPYDDRDETEVHFDTCEAQDRVTDSAGVTYRVTSCKQCRTRVWWQTTPRGKRRPMDCNGPHTARTCHFDTCAGRAEPKQEPTRTRTQGDPIHLWLADLGLRWPATRLEITSAFRKLAQQTHPDHGGTDTAFIKVKLAYDRLRELIPEGATV